MGEAYAPGGKESIMGFKVYVRVCTCHSQDRCPPPLRQGLSLAWNSPRKLDWLASGPGDHSASIFPGLGLPCLASYMAFGAGIRYSRSQDKHLSNRAISQPDVTYREAMGRW